MANKAILLLFLAAATAAAQDVPLDLYSSVKFNLPNDSPVSMLSANYGDTRATARGGALVLDLHMAISLRNQDSRRIRAITILVTAQEAAPGGRASYSVPTLDVGPGEVFPVKIDVRLVRPLQAGTGPLVQVALDGVLFEGLGFYGPNTLNSRRTMTFWEMENQRDRQYLKQLLSTKGVPALQQEVIDSLNRQAERPGVDVQMSRRASGSAATAAPERLTQFAFLKLPDCPVKPESGTAEISGNEARDARITVRNYSTRPVRYVEMGWVLKDKAGHEFLAGSVPAYEPDLFLPAGKSGQLLQETSLHFSHGAGQPVAIEGMTAFVSQVEYSDGEIWVPSRQSLGATRLGKLVPPSPEEQRLTDLYKKKGIHALLADLGRH